MRRIDHACKCAIAHEVLHGIGKHATRQRLDVRQSLDKRSTVLGQRAHDNRARAARTQPSSYLAPLGRTAEDEHFWFAGAFQPAPLSSISQNIPIVRDNAASA